MATIMHDLVPLLHDAQLPARLASGQLTLELPGEHPGQQPLQLLHLPCEVRMNDN